MVAMSKITRAGWREIRGHGIEGLESDAKIYRKPVGSLGGVMTVIVGTIPGPNGGCHMSISHGVIQDEGLPLKPGRYPNWDEIKSARYLFCPKDVTMAMLLPPMDQYVNHHETCFHLHQVPEGLEDRT